MRSPALAVLSAVARRRPGTPVRRANIGSIERAGTVLTGVGLLALAVRRPSLTKTMAGVLGGALVYRGARGRSRMYEALGMSTARPRRIERVITISRPPDELHRAWRDPAVRGRTMQGIEELDVVTDDAREMMRWRASDRGPAGHITFQPAASGRGTEVRLALDGGSAAEGDDVLRRFKQLSETGEIPTSASHPPGRGQS
jgi:uncharacterized membrane protein